MSEQIRDKYNGLMDGAYAAFVQTGLLRQMHGQVADIVSSYAASVQKSHLRILDIGVGVGTHLTRILDKLPSSVTSVDVVAVDPAERALAALDQSLVPYEGLIREQLRFPKTIEELSPAEIAQIGQVDVALTLLTLHHIRGEQKQLALGILRRLNPGLFVVSEWNFNTEESETTGDIAFTHAANQFFARAFSVLARDGEIGQKATREFLSIEHQQIITFPLERRPKFMRHITDWNSLLAAHWSARQITHEYVEPERIFGILQVSSRAA